MPTDWKRMRNRMNTEAVDTDLQANQRVFDLTKKIIPVFEVPAPQPKASLATVAETARLGSQAKSALQDVISLTFGLGSTLDTYPVNTQPFFKSREAIINFTNLLKYRVVPTLAQTADTVLLNTINSQVGQIINLLDDIDTEYLDLFARFGDPTELQFVGQNNLGTIEQELRAYDPLREELSSLLYAIPRLAYPTEGQINPVFREEVKQSEQDARIPQSGQGRSEASYAPSTFFQEDNDFYVPESDSEHEETEGGQRRQRAPQTRVKAVYAGVSKPKVFANRQARTKTILLPNPVYDPIRQQINDMEQAEAKHNDDVENDRLRFRGVRVKAPKVK